MKYIYLVKECNRLDAMGEIYTWGYFSDVKEAIKLVERLKKLSDEDEFPGTADLRLERVSLNLSELDSSLSEIYKRYILYKEDDDGSRTLIKNQNGWDELLEDEEIHFKEK